MYYGFFDDGFVFCFLFGVGKEFFVEVEFVCDMFVYFIDGCCIRFGVVDSVCVVNECLFDVFC